MRVSKEDQRPDVLLTSLSNEEGVMDKVIVSIRKGAVIDVEAPSYIDVVVRDYDIDGVDRNLLDVDKEGELYREMVW